MQGCFRQGILPVEPIDFCGDQPRPGWTERKYDARLLCDDQTRQQRFVINNPSLIHGLVSEWCRSALDSEWSFAVIRTRKNPTTGQSIFESNFAARRPA